MNESHEPHDKDLDIYADGSITSADAKVPHWLKWVFVIMPIWGVLWFYIFWNGSNGWFDRGYWNELQKAANTTTPYFNVNKQPETPSSAK